MITPAKKYSKPKYGGKLAAREREVCQLSVNGHSNLEIAELLTIEPQTVKVHLRHAFTKLGINKRLELLRFFAPEVVAVPETFLPSASAEKILDLISSGLTDQEAADHLGVPVIKVRGDVATLRKITGIKTRFELAVWWLVYNEKLVLQPENALSPYEMMAAATSRDEARAAAH